MRAPTLLRLSGIALMLALPLVIVGGLLHPRTHERADIASSSQALSHVIFAVAFALVLLGLPGLYAAHADRSGVVGLVGVVAMMLFSAYHVYLLLYEAGPVSAMSNDAAAERLFAPGGIVERGTLRTWFTPLGAVAPIIYGIALLRARVHPRWSGWLVIAFVPAFLGSAALLESMLPSDARETLLNLRFTPIWIAVSYALLLLGLAIPGYQLWRTQRLVFDLSSGRLSTEAV
jgi:hypothetical protein